MNQNVKIRLKSLPVSQSEVGSPACMSEWTIVRLAALVTSLWLITCLFSERCESPFTCSPPSPVHHGRRPAGSGHHEPRENRGEYLHLFYWCWDAGPALCVQGGDLWWLLTSFPSCVMRVVMWWSLCNVTVKTHAHTWWIIKELIAITIS